MAIPTRPAPPPPPIQLQDNDEKQQRPNNKFDFFPPTTATKSYKVPLSYQVIRNNKNATSSFRSSSSSTSTSSSTSIRCSLNEINYSNSTKSSHYSDDPFEMIEKSFENMDIVKKKTPPPRPPPPKKGIIHSGNKKQSGSSQSVNILSNIFAKKTNNNKQQSQNKSQQKNVALKRPNNNNNNRVQISHQTSRPYAVVPPFVHTNNDNNAELISFDSPPNSPNMSRKKPINNNESITTTMQKKQYKSFDNFDFLNLTTEAAVDPWETVMSDTIKDNNNSNSYDLNQIYQSVRNINSITTIKGDDLLSNGKSLLPPSPALTMPTIIKPSDVLRQQQQQLSKFNQNQSLKKMNEIWNQSADLYQSNFSEDNENDNVDNDNGDDDNSPPMPSYPPPTPPPVLDTSDNIDQIFQIPEDNQLNERGDGSSNSESYGIALYTFEGVEDGDLPFKENEKVYIIQKLNDNWYYGRNKRGCEGIFPANYIEIKIPLRNGEE